MNELKIERVAHPVNGLPVYCVLCKDGIEPNGADQDYRLYIFDPFQSVCFRMMVDPVSTYGISLELAKTLQLVNSYMASMSDDEEVISAEETLQKTLKDNGIEELELLGIFEFNNNRFSNGNFSPEVDLEQLRWEKMAGMMCRQFYVRDSDGEELALLRKAWFYPEGWEGGNGGKSIIIEDENGKELLRFEDSTETKAVDHHSINTPYIEHIPTSASDSLEP